MDTRGTAGTSAYRRDDSLAHLHVVICDDEPSTRFAVKRLLSQELGCTVSECGDGVEVLHVLAKQRVDLLILDIEMPTLDGADVLREVRESVAHRTLPVLILSKERRKETVLELVALGIDGYLTKPLRGETLRSTIDRLRPRLATSPRHRPEEPTPAVASGPAAALIVDGDAAFRRFFVRESRLGVVAHAGSGTEALAIYRLAAPPVVFIGGSLGILAPRVLAARLRTMAAGRALRIISLGDSTDADRSKGSPDGDFDLTIVRTHDPERLRTELAQLGQAGPCVAEPHLAEAHCVEEPVVADDAEAVAGAAHSPQTIGLTALCDEARNVTVAVVKHVFSLIVDADIELSDATEEPEPTVSAFVDITLIGRGLIVLGMHASKPSMNVFAAQMFGKVVADLTSEDRTVTAQELVRQVGGHLLQDLGDDRVSDCSDARPSHDPSGVDRGPADRQVGLSFAASAITARLTLTLDIYRHAATSAPPDALADRSKRSVNEAA